MKKVLLIFSLLMIFMSCNIALAEEQQTTKLQSSASGWYYNNVIFTKGQLTEIGKDNVRVEGDGGYRDIVLNISATTHIVNAEDGTPVLFSSLQKGGSVTAYYGPGVSKSMPPQGNAFALVVGTPAQGNSAGIYMKAGSVQKVDDDRIKVLSSNGDRLITITSEVFPNLNYSIKEGSDLLVWYEMMTMSLPGQAVATKAVLLPATIKVYLGAEVVVVNGKEVVLGGKEGIAKKDMVVFLPIRKIAEALGYNIIWHTEQQQIELKDGTNTVAACKIGSNSYQKGQSVVGLAKVPELINGKLFVPLNFFTDVLSVKVDVSYRPV